MTSPKSAYLILSTVTSAKEADRIARLLIREKLAACVNIIPRVESIFRWQGKVTRASERLLVIKTTRSGAARVKVLIRKHHSYQVPEIIGWPVRFGHKPYLDWIFNSVRR